MQMAFQRIRGIIGSWRLVATHAVDDHGRPMPAPYGPQPQGIVVFSADGRMMAVLCDGRARLPAGEIIREFSSYCGNFTFDGEQLVTLVDASSNPGWVGGEQVRAVRFAGECLMLKNGNRSLVWERLA